MRLSLLDWQWLPAVWMSAVLALGVRGAIAQPPAGDGSQANPPTATADRQQRLDRRDRYVEQADAFWDDDKLPEAVAAAEAALAIDREVHGPDHDKTVETLELLADLHTWTEDFPTARGILQQLLEIQTRRFGKANWRVTDARLDLDELDELESLPEKDRRRLRKADRLIDQVAKLHEEGRFVDESEAVDDALDKASDIRLEVLDSTHLAYAQTEVWRGLYYFYRGSLDLGEDNFRDAAEVYKKTLGDAHPAYATLLCNLGEVHYRRREFQEALELARQSLAIQEQAWGPDHAETFVSLKLLSKLLEPLFLASGERSLLAEAKTVHERIRTREAEQPDLPKWKATDARLEAERLARLGQLDPAQRQRLWEAEQLAARLRRGGLSSRERAKAVGWAQTCLETYREILGQGSGEYVRALDQLGMVHFSRSKYEEAERFFRQAVEAATTVFGADHPQYARTVYHLALACIRTSVRPPASSKAVEALRRARQVNRRVHGTEHRNYRAILELLVERLDTLAPDHEDYGEFEIAVEYRRELLEVKTELLGGEHWQVADARWALDLVRRKLQMDDAGRKRLEEADRRIHKAHDLAEAGEYAEAVPVAQQALDIRKEFLGEEHPEVAESLVVLGALWSELERHDRAEDALQRAGQVLRKQLGDEHPRYFNCLTYTGAMHARRGELVRALESQRRVIAGFEKLLAEDADDDDRYEFGLRTLEGLLERAADEAEERDDFAVVARHYLELAKLRAKLYYEQNWRVADARYLAGRARRLAALTVDERRQVTEAETKFKQTEQLTRQEKYHEALASYGEIAATIGRLLGESDYEFACALGGMGQVHALLGDYRQAEAQMLRAGEIVERELGPSNPDYGTHLHMLAELYFRKGDYARAEALYQQCDDVLRTSLTQSDYDPVLGSYVGGYFGEDHPRRARVVLDRGSLYFAMGDNVRARQLFEEARNILQQSLGEEDWAVVGSLSRLGVLYFDLDDTARAEPLLEKVSEICRKLAGDDSPSYAVSLVRLARLRFAQAKDAEARGLATRARDILEKAVAGRTTDAGAITEHCWLSVVNRYLDDPGEAAKHLQQIVEIRRRLGQEEVGIHAVELSALAAARVILGDNAGAEQALRKALAISRKQLDLTAAIQSERQQMAMVRMHRRRLDSYLSLAARGEAPAPEAYQHVLLWKGSVFARQRQLRLLRGASKAGGKFNLSSWELDQKFASLERITNELATLAWSTPQIQRRKEVWIRQLTRQKEEIESELARLSAEFRDLKQLGQRTPANVQAALPADAAVVDFLEYRREIPPAAGGTKLTFERHLAAFVVRRDRPIGLVDLGPAAPIAEAVDRWRSSFGTGTKGAGAGDELRSLVWEPLEKHLQGARTVLVSPDGALCRFPLAALPGETPGSYLIETLAIAVVPVPQLLPELLARKSQDGEHAQPPTAPDSMLLVGNVDFNADPGRRGAVEESLAEAGEASSAGPTAKERSAIPATSRAAVRPGMLPPFQPTSGFQGEFKALNELYRQTHPGGQVHQLQAAGAIEDAVRQAVPGNRYVHLITHAFFAPPEVISALSGTAEGDRSAQRIMTPGEAPAGGRDPFEGLHPGVLSGIALAGANRGAQPIDDRNRLGDDGILTALETAELDLSAAELVVLSACETGLGPVAGGEGLLGLQRAFQVAGARTVVASLWKVDDTATEQLMTHFYQNLWQKKGLPPLEALRQAQLAILNGQKPPAADGDRGKAAGQSEESGSRAGFGPEFNVPEQAPRMRTSPRLWAAWVLSGDPGSLAAVSRVEE